MPRRPDGYLRAFGMSAGQMTSELRSLEKRLDLEILDSKRERVAKKTENYEQFEADLRKEAADMAELYEVFYCLENSIRRLVSAMLFEAEGVNWWDSDRVNEDRIRRPCKDRRSKEVDHAVTPRSDQLVLQLRILACFSMRDGGGDLMLASPSRPAPYEGGGEYGARQKA